MQPEENASEVRRRLEKLEQEIDATLLQPSSPTQERSVLSPEQLERLLDIAQFLNGVRDRRRLLSFVSEKLREFFDAEHSFVVLFGPADSLQIHSAPGEEPAEYSNDELPVSRTILERVRTTRQPLLVDESHNADLLRSQRSIKRLKLASVMCVPLIADDEVMGVLHFDHRGKGHPFPATDVRLLTVFASQLATALRNLQLIECLERSYSEMRAAHSTLVQAERYSILGEMAAGVAHDFNNTLFLALGVCDILLLRDELPREVREGLERIRTCSLDAADSVRRIQSFAKGGRAETEEGIDLNVLVDEMPALTRQKWLNDARRRGIQINVIVDKGEVPPAAAHASEVREILTNLIFNAVDAMNQSGNIVLTTGCRDGGAFVAVRDEGVGMDEATRARLFEPSFSTKSGRGFGFGLSTSHAIARRIGGDITIEQTAPGKGTTIALWLKACTPVKREQTREAARFAASLRVLVVEDDELVRGALRSMLQSVGVQVTVASGGLAALDACERETFDAVLTDLGMPGMSGVELARRLQSKKPGQPVILLTGWNGLEAVSDQDRLLFAASVTKPLTLQDLRVVLSQLFPADK